MLTPNCLSLLLAGKRLSGSKRELALTLISCNAQKSGPFTLPGQHTRKLNLLLVVQVTSPIEVKAEEPCILPTATGRDGPEPHLGKTVVLTLVV